MKILLTRHGQTDWNVLGKVQGITDIELNDTGIKQAEKTREELLNYPIDIILSSPLKRAKKTAEIIGKGRNIPIIIEPGLKERCFGKFEGKTREEIDSYEMWNYNLNKQYEDVESVKDLFKRVDMLLNKVKQTYQDKTVLLVTHGGVCVPIRAYFEGMPEDTERLTNLGLGNCEIKKYEL